MEQKQPTPQQIDRYFRADFIEKHGESPVTWKRLDRAFARFERRLVDTVIGGVAPHLKKLRVRVEELEKEVQELKANGPNLADAFKGGWMPGDYRRGHLVTMSGSLWLALADSTEKPGTGSNWKMVTKRGSDGKDLR